MRYHGWLLASGFWVLARIQGFKDSRIHGFKDQGFVD
jgi:hypothetical protein